MLPMLQLARHQIGTAGATAGRRKVSCSVVRPARSSAAFAVVALAAAALPQERLVAQPLAFEDVAASAGVDFVVNHHPTDQKRMIETMAGGLAVLDYNGDGRPDIYFTNGAEIPSLRKAGPADWNRLYRNDGGWKFTDVTAEAGVAGRGYSQGAAAADFDNDGHMDLFVAGVQANQLFRNRGDGTFEDVTATAGIASDRWSVAAGWFDFDGDGLLDLFVVNYADWTVEFNRYCGDRDRDLRVYCHPKYLKPIANRLYRNRGDGTFEDISDAGGLAAHAGRGMSVAFLDFDADGRQDAFVTNDNLPNFLFRNLGGGKFSEEALLAGVALPGHGKPVASMGADARDYDNDGHADLIVTALAGETYPLFRNLGDGLFEDVTYPSGVAGAVSRLAGWGVGFVDFDNDGWKDLFTANSHVNDVVEQFEPYEYLQESLVLRNREGKFAEAVALPGKRAHRGSGFADFDGDGRVDFVISALGAPARLWRNVSPTAGASWIAFELEGSASNRDGVGACIRIGEQVNCRTSSAGYASSSLVPVHFGLGDMERVEEAVILWPSGTEQSLKDLQPGRVVTVREP